MIYDSTQQVLLGELNRFRSFRALVIGDFMLDAYTSGRVKRISPEAPVQILEVLKQESRPGGAGNAVLNLIALGGSVVVFGRIGADQAGNELHATLKKAGADVSALLIEPGYQTPIKNRLIADSQQLLRVDFEKITSVGVELESLAIARMQELIPSMQVVAISDYGKGFLSHRVISAAIDIAQSEHVPCIVDPKGIDFTKYRGATLLKPNLGEAHAAAKMSIDVPLDEVSREIFKTTEVRRLLITRSEAGMSLFEREGSRIDFPVRSREVKDVTGAGDTVLAVICSSLANGIDLRVAAQLANIAAGIAIERMGCVQVDLSAIGERLLETDFERT